MIIAVDLDATITAYPSFFKAFTAAMIDSGHQIHIVTDRPPGTENRVKELLDEYGIKYDKIIITNDKFSYILEKGIQAIFDDTDEYIQNLPEEVAVFKIREHYNFDLSEKKWLYSERTVNKI